MDSKSIIGGSTPSTRAKNLLPNGKFLPYNYCIRKSLAAMYNWSTDITELKKDRKAYTVWRLEQMVNFGLGKEKIKAKELKKNWKKLDLDPLKKNYLKMLLWPRR